MIYYLSKSFLRFIDVFFRKPSGFDGYGCIFIVYHGPPKPTCLEVFIVNNLVFSWLKASIFHGFGGSWYFKDHLDRELLPFIAAFVGPSLPPWVGFRKADPGHVLSGADPSRCGDGRIGGHSNCRGTRCWANSSGQIMATSHDLGPQMVV